MKVDLKNVETEDLINELYRRQDKEMLSIYPINTTYTAQVMDVGES